MQQIRFFAPETRVRNVATETRQGEVSFHGSFERLDTDLYEPGKDVIEDFANCLPKPESIQRFLRRYGLLRTPRSGNQTFVLRLVGFTQQQHQFQLTWGQLLGPVSVEPKWMPDMVLPGPINRIAVTQGTFEFLPGGLTFVAEDLFSALVLSLFPFAQRGVLKKCRRPDCTHLPYFISEHPRATYCSEECAEWAQAQWKKGWWQRQGEQWLEQRRRAKKSRKPRKRRNEGRT